MLQGTYSALVTVFLASLLAMACSSEQATQGDRDSARQSPDGPTGSAAPRTSDSPATTTQETGPVAVGLGENADLGDLYLRAFEVRSEDTVYSTPGPGEPHVSRGGPSAEYLAIDYVVENELYFLNLSLGTSIPPDWEFAAHAERSAFVVSLGAVTLLLWGIIRQVARQKWRETFIGRVAEFLQGRYGGRTSRLWARIRESWLRFGRLGRPSSGRWWVTLLALTITALAVSVVQGWSLLWSHSAVKPLMCF